MRRAAFLVFVVLLSGCAGSVEPKPAAAATSDVVVHTPVAAAC